MLAPGDVLGITIFENVKDDPLLGNTGQRVSRPDRGAGRRAGLYLHPLCRPHQGRGPDARRPAPGDHPQAGRPDPDPQVTVARLAGDGSTVSISGAVAAAGVYPIERPTRTLAAMLAKSGGVPSTPAVAIVRVTRGGRPARSG
jgi:polysaccharide export outer membrane protein